MDSLIQTLTASHTGADGKINIDPSTLLKALAEMVPSETAAPKARKPKTLRDPNKPKQPKSAYFCWSDVARDDARSKLETVNGPEKKVTVGQVSKEISVLWKAMSAEEKKPFEDQSKAERVIYAEKKAAYEAEHGITPTVRRSVKFDDHVVPSTPEGWSGPFDGYLEKTIKDPETGKNFSKSFHSFDDAVTAAVRLNAGGITRTPAGFKIRAARSVSINAASRLKNEMSWIFNSGTSEPVTNDDVDDAPAVAAPAPVSALLEDVMKTENTEELQKHSKTCASHMKIGTFPMKCNCNGHESLSDEIDEASVEEFEHDGVTYLKDDDGNLYPDTDDDEGDAIGKVHADGRVDIF